MKDIVQSPHPVLRQTATAVAHGAITSPEIRDIIANMNSALDSEDDGVAIAAPQIGVPLRIFVVSKKASKKFAKEYDSNAVFINPEIIRLGKGKSELTEGCLSVRWKYGTVKRSTTATVRALNADGNEFVINGRGLLAQIFQHEIDHLDGILFTDRARDVEDLPPQ